jgi:hypothetical protein
MSKLLFQCLYLSPLQSLLKYLQLTSVNLAHGEWWEEIHVSLCYAEERDTYTKTIKGYFKEKILNKSLLDIL